MKRSLAALAFALCLPVLSCAPPPEQDGPGDPVQSVVQAATSRVRVVTNGSQATASSSDGIRSVSINVSETDRDTLFVSVVVAQRDTSVQVCDGGFCFYPIVDVTQGFGLVPARAFKINDRSATLEATLSNTSQFTLERCRIDETGATPTVCAAVPSGTVSVRWAADGMFTQQFDGKTITTSGNLQLIQDGKGIQSSAVATGTVLGVPLNASGFLVRNTQKTIEVVRK